MAKPKYDDDLMKMLEVDPNLPFATAHKVLGIHEATFYRRKPIVLKKIHDKLNAHLEAQERKKRALERKKQKDPP